MRQGFCKQISKLLASFAPIVYMLDNQDLARTWILGYGNSDFGLGKLGLSPNETPTLVPLKSESEAGYFIL